jgi:integrase
VPPRTRRRRGHIESLPSGHFRAIVFTGIDPLTRRRRYVKATCKTRSAAEQELTRLQREVDENKHPKAAITLAEAVEKWLEVAELEETTRDRYEDLIRLYILPTFGDLQIGRLDAELMERFYAKLHRCKHMCPARPPKEHVHQPLSTSTTRKIHYIIRGALERAVRWGYLGVNPATMAYAPTPAKTKPDPPTAAEAAALLNEAWRDPEWGLLLWLTMVTGCRRGELCSIRWRHVDFHRADLCIELATAQPRSGILEKAPKSGEGRRISLDPHTLTLLRQQLYRTEPAAMRAFRVSALGWGVGLLGESALRVPLVYLLPIDVMVGLSTAMMVVTMLGLAVWNAAYIAGAARQHPALSVLLPVRGRGDGLPGVRPSREAVAVTLARLFRHRDNYVPATKVCFPVRDGRANVGGPSASTS